MGVRLSDDFADLISIIGHTPKTVSEVHSIVGGREDGVRARLRKAHERGYLGRYTVDAKGGRGGKTQHVYYLAET